MLSSLAVWTGLEPATPCVTGRYSNQLNYHTVLADFRCKDSISFPSLQISPIFTSQPDKEVGLCLARHPILICHYIPPFQTPYRINLCRRVKSTSTGSQVDQYWSEREPVLVNKVYQYWYI